MNENDPENFDAELMSRASELARDIQPNHDLWPNIAEAIATPPSVLPWKRFIAQAAVVFLLVGGSSGLTYLALSGDDASTLPVMQGQDLVFQPVSGSFGSQYTLGPDFQDARNVLESRLEQEMLRLSPEAREDVNKNLETIRTAILDMNRALANEPDNMLLQKLLLSSYREELSVMKQVNGITNSVMFRDDF